MDNKKHSCEKKRTYFLQYFIPVNRNSHFRNEKKKCHKNNAEKETAKFIHSMLPSSALQASFKMITAN